MPDGQTTGQRVEVRITPFSDPNLPHRPDIVAVGQVVAWDLRGYTALVQTDEGRFIKADIPTLSILDSQVNLARRVAASAAEAASDHDPQSCGPLCRTHGDVRDTNMREPVAVG